MSRFVTVKANMTILKMFAVSQTAASIVMNVVATLVTLNYNIVHVDRFVAVAAELLLTAFGVVTLTVCCSIFCFSGAF